MMPRTVTRYGYILAIVLTSCWPTPTTPSVGDPEACPDACERLRDLGCRAAEPTPEGVTCLAICLDTEATGWTTMHPSCIAVAETCEEASRGSADGCAQ